MWHHIRVTIAVVAAAGVLETRVCAAGGMSPSLPRFSLSRPHLFPPSSMHPHTERAEVARPGYGCASAVDQRDEGLLVMTSLPTHCLPSPHPHLSSPLSPSIPLLWLLYAQNALRSRGQDMDALARWINEMKEEGGSGRVASLPLFSLVSTLRRPPKQNALRSRGQDMDALARWINEMKEEGGQVERLKKLNKLLQGWYADANSRAEDALQREKEEFIRAKAAEELAAAGDLLILEMEAKFSEMRMKLAA
ncbi:unnamed protein product [Closterium sp. NIES-54]